MNGKAEDISEHLKKIGKTAVRFDFYLMKRAFGMYYATWAAAIFTLMVLSYISNIPGQSNTTLTFYVLLNIGVIIVAVDYTQIVFRKAFMLFRLESDLQMQFSLKSFGKNAGIGLMILIFAMFVIIGINLVSPDESTVLSMIILWIVDFYIYMTVRMSFGKIPPEGILAVATFAFSNTASSILFLQTGNNNSTFQIWMVTVIGWIISSLYSFYNARKMYSLEDDNSRGGIN